MTDQPIFSPYEQRLELRCSQGASSLLLLSDQFWDEVVEHAGARVLLRHATPYFRSYVLSLSTLIVWADRCVLLTCSEAGVIEAF